MFFLFVGLIIFWHQEATGNGSLESQELYRKKSIKAILNVCVQVLVTAPLQKVLII